MRNLSRCCERLNPRDDEQVSLNNLLVDRTFEDRMKALTLSHGLLLLTASCFKLVPVRAQQTVNPRYPLRLHLLAVDDTHRTPRLQPNWCSSSVPALVGDLSGAGPAEPCGSSGSLSFGGDEDFSGAGRADLVSPPSGTQALSFTYEGCSRLRVPPGFQGLPARWKKPGKLEVLAPSDDIAAGNREPPTQRCTLKTTLYDFVYLRLRNGSLVKVSQEAYFRKPALRVFLSGGPETLQPRVPPTVSVRQLTKSPQ